MPTSQPFHCSLDTFIFEAMPDNGNFQADATVKISGVTGNRRYAYMSFPIDVSKYFNAHVVDAKLRVTVKGTNWSGHQINVFRITQRWAEDTVITWNNPLTVDTPQTDSTTTGTVSNGDEIEIDVTNLVRAWFNGKVARGLSLRTPDSVKLEFHSSEAVVGTRPKLVISYLWQPDPPDNLQPDGQVIAEASPRFQWDVSSGDDDNITQVHLQLSTDNTFAAPYWDSGWVAQNYNYYDTSTDPSPPTVANGATNYWRVQIKNTAGVASDWSQYATITRHSLGTLSITAPSNGSTVATTTPLVTWSFTGATQQEWKLWIYDLTDDQSADYPVYTKDRHPSTDTSFRLPSGVITRAGRTYRVRLRVWDQYSRGQSDDPYVERTSDFSFVPSGATPPTSLTAATVDGHVHLTWTSTLSPTFFALFVDGVVADDRIDPADSNVGGTNYAWDLWHVEPGTTHTYEVQSVVVSGSVYQHSNGNPTATATFFPQGIYINDPHLSLDVKILGNAEVTSDLGEQGETYTPIGRQDPVRIVDSIRGLEGHVDGVLATTGTGTSTRTAAKELANFLKIKKTPLDVRRLVWGFRNIPVIIGESAVPSQPEVEENYGISFDFWQVGEFDVRMR